MHKLPLKSLRFLDWLFHPPAFRLKEITVDEFNVKTSFHSETAGAARSGSLPQHIFEVVYDESPSSSTSGAGSSCAHIHIMPLLYSPESHTHSQHRLPWKHCSGISLWLRSTARWWGTDINLLSCAPPG